MANMSFTDYFHPDTNFFDTLMTFEKIDNDEQLSKCTELMNKKIDEMNALPSPRMIKTHLPAYLLPRAIWTVRPKMFYISREAKDLAVSLYHMNRDCFNCFLGTTTEFFCSFCNDFIDYGPFYEHISSFWQLRHFGNLLFLTYEELSENAFECVNKISNFLECSYSDEKLRQLIEHVGFGKMREQIKSVANNDNFK